MVESRIYGIAAHMLHFRQAPDVVLFLSNEHKDCADNVSGQFSHRFQQYNIPLKRPFIATICLLRLRDNKVTPVFITIRRGHLPRHEINLQHSFHHLLIRFHQQRIVMVRLVHVLDNPFDTEWVVLEMCQRCSKEIKDMLV